VKSLAADRERHDRMVALHRQLAASRTSHEQENLKRQINAADRRIDRLVYDLYDLTEEEIPGKTLRGHPGHRCVSRDPGAAGRY